MQLAESTVTATDDQRPWWAWATIGLGGLLLLYALLASMLGAYVDPRGFGIDGRPALWALGAAAPSLVQAGEWWRIGPTLFLHPTWWPDLLVTLVVVGALGPRIERRLGWASLVLLFLLPGFAGACLAVVQRLHTPYGAGPALGGLTGAAAVLLLLPRQPLSDRLHGLPGFLGATALQVVGMHLSGAFRPAYWIAGVATGAVLTLAIHSSTRTDAGAPITRASAAVFLAGLAASAALAVPLLPLYLPLCAATRRDSLDARIAAFNRVVEERPAFLEARIYMVRLLASGSQMEPMLREYRSALQRDSRATRSRLHDLADRLVARGDRQAQLGSPEAAAERYAAAVELAQSPHTLARAHNSLAWTLVAYLQRDYDRALISAEAASRLAPDDPAILDTLAWTLHRLRRDREALPIQQRAMELMRVTGPDSALDPAELTYHLGAILDALGRKNEAARAYAEALRSQGDHQAAQAALRRMNGLAAPAAGDNTPLGADPAVRTGVL